MKNVYCAKRSCQNIAKYVVSDMFNSLDRAISAQQIYCLKHAQDIYQRTIAAEGRDFVVSMYLIELISTSEKKEKLK